LRTKKEYSYEAEDVTSVAVECPACPKVTNYIVHVDYPYILGYYYNQVTNNNLYFNMLCDAVQNNR
jgi:hypothetical protein